AGQILVKVHAAAINPKDTFIRKGRFKRFTGNDFPKTTGFDFSGVVAESQVADLSVGTPVFGMLDGWHGATCAEYVVAIGEQVAIKPD
ncbi:MAG: alcohol dehydrogenase catalytic domain-containing protein, partial [Chloroflexota bacterium]